MATEVVGRTGVRRTASFVALVALVAGCSGDNGKSESGEREELVQPGQVCGGLLGKKAAASLERFYVGDLHEPSRFKPGEASRELKEGSGESIRCTFYNDNARTPANLSFRVKEENPKAKHFDYRQGKVYEYDIGKVAYTADRVSNDYAGGPSRYVSGLIVVSCPVGESRVNRLRSAAWFPDHPKDNARLGISAKKETSEAVMEIILSASRHMAKELGCLEDTGLPGKVPKPSEVP
ncbi:hypothetical protein [Streptomyces sp. NPDC005438]|uniref:hypothetical protein n=1 Tax=Streptomyces sp. NPDC005438 TaxID=3156880 RepID=UPI0033AD0ECB